MLYTTAPYANSDLCNEINEPVYCFSFSLFIAFFFKLCGILVDCAKKSEQIDIEPKKRTRWRVKIFNYLYVWRRFKLFPFITTLCAAGSVSVCAFAFAFMSESASFLFCFIRLERIHFSFSFCCSSLISCNFFFGCLLLCAFFTDPCLLLSLLFYSLFFVQYPIHSFVYSIFIFQRYSSIRSLSFSGRAYTLSVCLCALLLIRN